MRPEDGKTKRRELVVVPHYRYAHDEVCAVVTVPPEARQAVQQALPELHARVGDTLNALITRSENADIAGKRLRAPAAGGAARARTPHVFLPRATDPSTALLFYSANPQGTTHRLTPHTDAATRALVDHLNDTLRDKTEPAAHPGTIAAATPNWLSLGAVDPGMGTGVGGPGCAPSPVARGHMKERHDADPQRRPFHFQLANGTAALAASGDAARSRVIVALLDTRPARAAVQSAAQRCAANGVSNLQLRALADDDHLWQPAGLSLEAAEEFAHLQHVIPNWSEGLEQWANARDDATLAELRAGYYNIADHGLFVTGIIKDIAQDVPSVDIRLIRVLDDAGIGDLQGIARVLAALPEALLDGRKPSPDDPEAPRLVVNLSLMLEAPRPEGLLGEPDADSDDSPLHDLFTVLSDDHRAILEIIDWLGREWGALVVAAAGNDALAFPSNARPEARAPACYDSGFDFVLGVGAVARPADPLAGAPPAAAYSNRSRRGVAVWGGNAERAGSSGPPRVVALADGSTDAVVGLFSAEQLPFDGGPNETGWAYWSGTSFATPVVSGLAARYWAAHPHASAADVSAYIHGLATASEAELGCAGIVVSQA